MKVNPKTVLLDVAAWTILALVAVTIVTGGCASTPVKADSGLLQVIHGGRLYLALPISRNDLKSGDLVAIKQRGYLAVSTVGQERGEGVYTLVGPGFILLTENNYVGKLYPLADSRLNPGLVQK